MADEEDEDFKLMIPFVPVTSKGGPYDDLAYTAGFEAGTIWGLLKTKFPPELIQTTVRTPNVHQVDLLAMHFNYTLVTEGPIDETSEWTEITIRKSKNPFKED